MVSRGSPCPEVESLSAYVDRVLSRRDADTLERHLQDCPACLEILADWADAVDEVIDAYPAVPLRPAHRPLPRAAAAAAVLLLLGGGWLALRPVALGSLLVAGRPPARLAQGEKILAGQADADLILREGVRIRLGPGGIATAMGPADDVRQVVRIEEGAAWVHAARGNTHAVRIESGACNVIVLGNHLLVAVFPVRVPGVPDPPPVFLVSVREGIVDLTDTHGRAARVPAGWTGLVVGDDPPALYQTLLPLGDVLSDGSVETMLRRLSRPGTPAVPLDVAYLASFGGRILPALRGLAASPDPEMSRLATEMLPLACWSRGIPREEIW